MWQHLALSDADRKLAVRFELGAVVFPILFSAVVMLMIGGGIRPALQWAVVAAALIAGIMYATFGLCHQTIRGINLRHVQSLRGQAASGGSTK